MQYLKNLYSRISIKMPFRMMIGRFGIKLAKFGRVLQTRYANWNSEFRLEVEFCVNPLFCLLHVSEPILAGSVRTLSFNGPEDQPKKITPLVKDLFCNVKGLTEVIIYRHKIAIMRTPVFQWREILPTAEEIVLRHLAAK